VEGVEVSIAGLRSMGPLKDLWTGWSRFFFKRRRIRNSAAAMAQSPNVPMATPIPITTVDCVESPVWAMEAAGEGMEVDVFSEVVVLEMRDVLPPVKLAVLGVLVLPVLAAAELLVLSVVAVSALSVVDAPSPANLYPLIGTPYTKAPSGPKVAVDACEGCGLVITQ
jgi:hypothetical protein